MSEMIERVKGVLRELPVRDNIKPGGELDELRLWDASRNVIAALREPTDAMLAAVYGNHGETNGSDSAARATWQAMIDASLT